MNPKTAVLKPQKKTFDFWLLAITTLLVAIGLIAIYDVTVVTAYRDFGDKLYYFKNQLLWAGLGIISLAFFSLFDYHKILKLSPIFLIISVILLIAVLVPFIGTKTYGARRWFNFGSFSLQPSEFAKLALVFYLTMILSKFEKYKYRFVDIALVLFIPALLVTFLVLRQPDLGTAMIFVGVTSVMYFIGGGPIWHFALTAPFIIIAGITAVLTAPYRFLRLKAFLDPTFDPQGASYQINQILIALSSGGLLGVGLGGARSKFAFIPEVQSDAIFAVIVEELGFLGAICLTGLFLLLIFRAIKIAQESQNYAGKILAMGIVGLLAIQILLNLASNVALVPLTGIPLPFISYGGSSLFITLTSIGILSNIKRQS